MRNRLPATGGRHGRGPTVWLLAIVATCVVFPYAAARAAPANPASSTLAAAASQVQVPPGVTAGVAVFDRQTGTFTERLNTTKRFRSASVVKLLIILDYLWNRGPDYSMPVADKARLQLMLRRSDDDAASYYWEHRGGSAIIDRMVTRLHLRNTAPPPAGYPGYWGYVAITPADTVRIYRYILDSAPDAVRTFIMSNLHHSERCGTDGYDQYFGIPSVFAKPWAAKQGWSGFGSGGCTLAKVPEGAPAEGEGTGATARAHRVDPASPERAAAGVDLSRVALHSTGTVGQDDRSIVAVFTLQPRGTPYGTAYSKVTALVRSLDVPGGRHRAGTWLSTYGVGVQVRADTDTGAPMLTTLPAGVDVLVSCQRRGQTVTANGYTNPWWAYLPVYGGYMTNIYLTVAPNKIPDVPVCGDG